jgi:protoporphyrinogen oxidase
MIRIIGAGFSGLSLAYFFTKSGQAVTVIEKNARTGGVISSEYRNKMLVESAANGFLASEKLEDLFADIGIQPLSPKKESRKKYIFRSGLRRWPLSLVETLTLVGRVIYGFLTGGLKPRGSESLNEWAQRTLGIAGNDYLIQPMVNGIFAQKTEVLNAKLVLGSLFFKKHRGHLKGLISAPNGMGEVIQKLESYLKDHGVLFELNKDVKTQPSIMQHNTFLAIDFYSAKSFFDTLKNQQPKLKKDGFKCLSLVRVTLNFKKPCESDRWVRCVVPK